MAHDHKRALLQIDQLGVHFGDRSGCSKISISSSRAGETISLLGPNGAGKSTLLKVIAGCSAGHACASFAERRPIVKGRNHAVVYVPQRTAVSIGSSRSTCSTSC